LNSPKNTYSASFTAGALLYEETSALLEYLNSENIQTISDQATSTNLLKVNSESARTRIIAEIIKRYKSVNNDVFKIFATSSVKEQKILLFYVCMKSYPLLFDFVFEVVIEKWLSLDLIIKSDDVSRFLDMKTDQHPEISKWSDLTIIKIRSSIIRIVKESGFIMNKSIKQVELNSGFLKNFVRWGDSWFLQAILLNKMQRGKIING
jgi:hypothetical protein